MSSFKDLRIVDNFYQTSSYFPMPTVVVSTLAADGTTSCGSYSLVAPYYIAGKGYYAMLLEARNSSNTAQHLFRGSKIALNFMSSERGNLKNIVALGWPGDTPAEKMKNCKFELEDGLCIKEDPSTPRPKVLTCAYQVMECTWMSELDNAQDDKPGEMNGYPPPYHDFNGVTSEFGAHFILRIDKILMKERYYNNIINGVKARDWPKVLICHGYRDSKNFWFERFRPVVSEILPIREASLASVRYAADRTDPNVHFTDEALMKLLNVPRIFLPTVLKGCVAWAKENGVTEVTAHEMDIINDKRAKEKNRK